ncbi:hypothetical protein B0H15DRAFT_955129 [Mycena belliarum]|uniref:Uncharacterized protein n=1 Tax=Mycena belliarum TaxID=1033014 RepID=A0AAD6TT15_9AGAR|nr:hypothetical protein B0H15DRAFT_955129 [Mycena belliae]
MSPFGDSSPRACRPPLPAAAHVSRASLPPRRPCARPPPSPSSPSCSSFPSCTAFANQADASARLQDTGTRSPVRAGPMRLPELALAVPSCKPTQALQLSSERSSRLVLSSPRTQPALVILAGLTAPSPHSQAPLPLSRPTFSLPSRLPLYGIRSGDPDVAHGVPVASPTPSSFAIPATYIALYAGEPKTPPCRLRPTQPARFARGASLPARVAPAGSPSRFPADSSPSALVPLAPAKQPAATSQVRRAGISACDRRLVGLAHGVTVSVSTPRDVQPPRAHRHIAASPAPTPPSACTGLFPSIRTDAPQTRRLPTPSTTWQQRPRRPCLVLALTLSQRWRPGPWNRVDGTEAAMVASHDARSIKTPPHCTLLPRFRSRKLQRSPSFRCHASTWLVIMLPATSRPRIRPRQAPRPALRVRHCTRPYAPRRTHAPLIAGHVNVGRQSRVLATETPRRAMHAILALHREHRLPPLPVLELPADADRARHPRASLPPRRCRARGPCFPSSGPAARSPHDHCLLELAIAALAPPFARGLLRGYDMDDIHDPPLRLNSSAFPPIAR